MRSARVEEYLTSLAGALHGPARAKDRMLDEVRDGLTDTAAAYAEAGVPPERAAELAVRDFGTSQDLLPAFQHELTVAQARHTARAAALAVPFAGLCWLLVRMAGRELWQLPSLPHLLATTAIGLAAGTAVLTAASLAATGPLARRLPTPDGLPRTVAWLGTASSVGMALAALLLVVLALVVTHWPLAVAAGALAAVSHAVVAASARACRRCAQVPA
ncbi:permease prefix domain 1-containing protein [Streptomyces sp. NPDC004111]|uniref:permease prefix domain 1-containing protein n=1 Tax=Streptomyces sp. NPDC004111 TaxID=3364690 RepID=UPI0036939DFB